VEKRGGRSGSRIAWECNSKREVVNITQDYFKYRGRKPIEKKYREGKMKRTLERE